MKKNSLRAVGIASTALIGLGLALAIPGVAQGATIDGLTGTVAANLDTTVNVNCTSFDEDVTSDDVLAVEGAIITFNVTGTCEAGMIITTLDDEDSIRPLHQTASTFRSGAYPTLRTRPAPFVKAETSPSQQRQLLR